MAAKSVTTATAFIIAVDLNSGGQLEGTTTARRSYCCGCQEMTAIFTYLTSGGSCHVPANTDVLQVVGALPATSDHLAMVGG